MKKYVALLRGINVSGQKKIPMADLRQALAKEGLQEVQTYIQSGNIVFDSEETDLSKISEKIEKVILDTFGFEVPTLVISQDEIAKIPTINPFLEPGQETKALYVGFLYNEPDHENVRMILTNPIGYSPINKIEQERNSHLDVLDDQSDFTNDMDTPDLLDSYINQLFRFSISHNDASISCVSNIFVESKTFKEFKSRIESEYGVQDSNLLKRDYEMAIAQLQSVCHFVRLLSCKDTFPFWEYRAIGESSDHNELNGRTLPAAHNYWSKIWPPNSTGCTCYVSPRLTNEVDTAKVENDVEFVKKYLENHDDGKAAIESGYDTNPASNFRDHYYIQFPFIFMKYSDGIGKSKMDNNFFERKLKVKMTTRNWNTILKLSDM